MFFRNFHPNMTKLKDNLVAAKGGRSSAELVAVLFALLTEFALLWLAGQAAYCCQCSWK
jgi:hypothetical protein